MLAIAAALWLAYLVPNWFKRREYLATERNAVRLQQTIRVLAESAEIPDAVRANLQAKQLAQAQRAELRQGPVAVGPVRQAPQAEDPRAVAARRLRRARTLLAVVLLVAAPAAVVQLVLIVTSGAVAASWVILAVSTTAALGSVSLLGRFAKASRGRPEVSAPRARRTSMSSAPARTETVAEREASWTPVPIPKPLYLSRSLAPQTIVADPSAALKLASAKAEEAVRAAQQEVAPIPVQQAAPSRFARMGIVDDATSAAPDIDAVLARRRAVG